MTDIKLTQLSHGGGCGCKLSPSILAKLLSELPTATPFPSLLVGTETSDDAAVFKLNDEQALVATTDFFMPIVDDPYDFGRIAATNALSDLYAMGAQPIMALAVVGMPVNVLPLPIIRQILAGGAAVCKEAHIPIAGGHSIDAPEPIYGLVALGLVHPNRVKRNGEAQANDVLILSKPLGIGILASAIKQGQATPASQQALLDTATQLNQVGIALAAHTGVHAMTDVTGFGLLGHLLEMCRGSQLGATVHASQLPLLPTAVTLVQQGIGAGGIERNWASYAESIDVEPQVLDWQRRMMADPQTSGGLLVSVAPDDADSVFTCLRDTGFTQCQIIGRMTAGTPRIKIIV